MTPDQVTNALTQALVQGGSTWLIATIVAFLPVLWTMTLILHLGRPYVLRTLRRCGLRLGADIWWMTYLLMRDALIVLTFALSWVFFQPNIVANNPLPITGPIAALCLLLALAVKMVRRVDDDLQAYRFATVFLVLGATLYYLPLTFGVEAASQEHLSWFADNLVSNANPYLALVIMWISLAGAALIAAWLFFRALASANRQMVKRSSRSTPVRVAA
jgi:hypothetical protein